MFVATTTFSLGHSLLSVDDIVSTVTEHSLKKVVVADTMSLNAMIPLASTLGESLAIGVRLCLVDKAEQERAPIYQPKVYPLSERAIRLLYEYLSRSFQRPYFYEQPRLDFESFYEMLAKSKGDFAVSTGDIHSLTKHPNFVNILDKVRSGVKSENLIFDICPIKTAMFDRQNYINLQNANSDNYLNAFFPAFYKKEDADTYPIHYSINKNVEFNFLKPYHQDFYFDDSRLQPAFLEMLVRLEKRFGKLDLKSLKQYQFNEVYHWTPQEPRLPSLSATPMARLKELAVSGFRDRLTTSTFGYTPKIEDIKTVYADRLKQELETIEKLKFADYFLLVYELTSWCKSQEIFTGPGRGSVGGSLIAFCLGITDVDPIRFGLMFERFINPTRIDLPDIDLDFMSKRRPEIVEHLIDRYGEDNVAAIVNYSGLQSRSALRSTCRILGLPENEYACSKLIPSQFGFSLPLEEAKDQVVDIAAFAKKYPSHWDKAKKLEGKLRNYSTHAAGIIVSNRPLINDAVVEVRSNTRIVNWDKKICEKQGLIKLDVLGLKTLDIIDLCTSFIKDRHSETLDINQIPLNDARVLDAFEKGNTGGVFQFEGGSVRRLLSDLSRHVPLTFDDLIAANALNRPGPIEAGLVKMYVDGKNGELHDVPHSSMESILEPTFNVICYQEQVMQVAVEFAGYTLPEADNLRKIMGKKLPEEMKKEANKFIDGAVSKHGVDRLLAEEVFDQISKFAFYAFNKSHSCAYSLLAYVCMWLKVNYPVEFYAASMSFVDDGKLRPMINEANKNGINVLPPSINKSTTTFCPADSNTIVAPLSAIKYVAAASEHIIHARSIGPFKCIEDLQSRTTKRIVNSRVLRAMEAVGALDEIAFIKPSVSREERSRALNEYLPGLPLGHVHIARKVALNASDKDQLSTLLNGLKKDMPNFVFPTVGKNARFMAIYDSATATEAKNGSFASSKAFKSVELALYKSGLSKTDGYWTGLVKRQKQPKEKIFTNETLEKSFGVVKREIEIFRPTVIVCLGSQTSRMFDPSMKGGILDNVGKVVYREDIDANVIFGFNPSQIFFHPEYEEYLDGVFETVSEML